ncbi:MULTISPECIES: hypothetical protein [unclassified Microbacterium]|uniref:hypothetical protein n=1 Tax=unclassified Microbacterium TaxID=2609290 RepID=UPI000EA9AB1B|nr:MULTISPECIES: hypothetical protein [unclassified Microbacterium]MBT2484804.1 hypothetical protein [Microbacterium sp. ISL-108]RKN67677.1 hypothetical protein D7252_08820 [Microbacterium sp. CGR2]
MDVIDAIDARIAASAKKRERLAQAVQAFLDEDNLGRGFTDAAILDGQPTTVLVEFQNETFAITVEDA